MVQTSKLPLAAKAPMANSSESPGKNGKITRPVSEKIIKNKKI
jgi:hypothetical protein